jgi:hypothetical protein
VNLRTLLCFGISAWVIPLLPCWFRSAGDRHASARWECLLGVYKVGFGLRSFHFGVEHVSVSSFPFGVNWLFDGYGLSIKGKRWASICCA